MTITVPCPHCGQPIMVVVNSSHSLALHPPASWTERIQERAKEDTE